MVMHTAKEKAYIAKATEANAKIAIYANDHFHSGQLVRNAICKPRRKYLRPLSRYDSCQLMLMLRLCRCTAAIAKMRSKLRKAQETLTLAPVPDPKE